MQKARRSVLVRALGCRQALLTRDQYSFFGNCIERMRL